MDQARTVSAAPDANGVTAIETCTEDALICAVPFLARYRDPARSSEPPLRLRTLVTSMGNSLRNRQFAWAFGGRLLVNLANSLGSATPCTS